jgi:hypothetical protein
MDAELHLAAGFEDAVMAEGLEQAITINLGLAFFGTRPL